MLVNLGFFYESELNQIHYCLLLDDTQTMPVLLGRLSDIEMLVESKNRGFYPECRKSPGIIWS